MGVEARAVKPLLAKYLGKTIEIHYGGTSTVRGKLVNLLDDVAELKDEEDLTFYVAISQIRLFWEVSEKEKPLGFVSPSGTRTGEKK